MADVDDGDGGYCPNVKAPAADNSDPYASDRPWWETDPLAELEGGADAMCPDAPKPDPALVAQCQQIYGDSPVCTSPLDPDDLNRGMSLPIDGPTYAPSALGDYIVVPDDNPDMPEGGILQSTYERELAVYDGIANGSSHIKVPNQVTMGDLMDHHGNVHDTPATREAAQEQKDSFHAAIMDGIRTIIEGPTGLEMTEDLDVGGPTRDRNTTIIEGAHDEAAPTLGCNLNNQEQEVGQPGMGCGSEIYINPDQERQSMFARDGFGEPLPGERAMSIGHELTHAYRNIHGISAPDDPTYDRTVASDQDDPTLEPRDINFREEFATVGLRGLGAGEPTEDGMRSDLCLAPLNDYSGFK